ncbi:TolC family outer membrane protein [Pacificimonas sp. WHA3]|uniref:TolC family outer membrane protein n=1 Tax=Pacificimonas pallii TaxID=2827236 RepID=A0ABS6SH08_9SPHN|nr:TolC family outer membrane protein [Pacificimonas pallii]MBV7257201.1 TolC family outer membrane protein [Pacificimonas pallii]
MSIRATPIALLLTCAMALPVQAETLREAIASAYATNPDITAARAGQRLTDEELVRAKAGIRPTISSTSVLDQETTSPGRFDDQSRLFNSQIQLSQPVWRGGQTINNIRAADKSVLAGRERLRATENQLILDTVTVYLDVLSNQSEVELTQGNVSVLEQQLQASTDRFEVGDVTRTDVAQSDARLALARSQLISAQANLEASRHAYRRIVGNEPVNLQPPPPLPVLPGTPEQAVDLALAESPFVNSAKLAEQSARYSVSSARGARLPSLDATFSVGYTNFRGLNNQIGGIRFSNVEFTQNIGARLTIPIYQGGQQGSAIRSAKARADQLREDATAAERQAIANVRTAFENLLSARATIQAASVAVEANELALEGTRAEQTVGTRNILDVLNAEQELLNAQVQLVRAERNAYVAGYSLLAATGRAEVKNLDVPVALYNAEQYLDRADDRWFDWAAEFDAQPLSTAVLPAETED